MSSVVATGCYVYALVPDDGRPLPDMGGVGGAPLRLVRAAAPAAAVVSDADALPERVRRADLLTHSNVLQALVADRDVVPVRFGSVYPSDDDMCAALLARNAASLRKLLARVEGRVEVQVKVGYDELAIAGEVVSGDRRVRRLHQVTQAAPGDQGARVELGRRFAEGLDARRARDARRISQELAKVSEEISVTDGSGDFGVVKVACLVRRAKQPKLDDRIDRLARQGRGRLDVEVLGPLPPYSFVSGTLAEVG